MLILLPYILITLFNDILSYKVSVKTKLGTILGNRQATVFDERIFYAFYGVPYAQAPIGRLRFKDPKPAKKFKRPFDATTEYHGPCAQAHIVHKHALYGNEDCLYLNIYTPYLPMSGKQILKAVIVWIHGYAFTSSFSHVHGPDFLIDNDVIVVTLTHRIGVFGFLKLNESDSNANMGLKDIVTGLSWINKNIEVFGGDKQKITVMGSGSASTFLTLLLFTKYNKLFSKMILQSGSIYSPSIFQSNESKEKNKLELELKNAGLKIKTASTKHIIDASNKIYSSKDMLNFQRPVIPFSPIIEGKTKSSLLTKTPFEIYTEISSTKINKPILTGFTSQESIPEIIPFIHNPHYLNLFNSFFKYMVPFADGCKFKYFSTKYKEVSNIIKGFYFKNGISDHSIKDFLKLSSDLLKYPVYKFIKSQLNLGNDKLYVYKFDYTGIFNIVKATSVPGVKTKVRGAAQGDEICYLLKCEPLWETYVKIKKEYNNTDRIFIKRISEMWANFAKFADPTPNQNYSEKWLPMTITENDVYLFSKENKRTNTKSEEKMFTFWNEIYAKYYEAGHCRRVRIEL